MGQKQSNPSVNPKAPDINSADIKGLLQSILLQEAKVNKYPEKGWDDIDCSTNISVIRNGAEVCYRFILLNIINKAARKS